jgi:uncharacterized integral membrane protein
MRLLTWLLLLVITFLVALVLVLTFIQPAFKTEVGAQILTIKTKAFPVYLYVLGAFVAGLLFGVLAMLSGYVRSKMDGLRKSKRLRELEERLAETEKRAVAAESLRSLSSGGSMDYGSQKTR